MKQIVSLIIPYDSEKKLLLQHRTEDAERLPGYWAFFGGGIDKDEKPVDAVIREAFEEINFECKNPRFVHEQDFILPNGQEGHMYLYIDYCQDKTKLKLKEGQDWGWFQKKETDKLKMVQHDRAIIEKIWTILK